MPNAESTATRKQLEDIVALDDKRAKGDPFTLTATLRKDVEDDLAALGDTDDDTAPAEGDRAGSSARQRRAFNEIARILRGGHRFIGGLDEDAVSREDRLQVFTTYGWAGGKVGRLDDDTQLLKLARLGVSVGAAEIPTTAWRYPAARVQRLQDQLKIVGDNREKATGGDREMATHLRNTALETARTTALRVRFHYCSATRDADQTPELTKIGFTPRHDPQPTATAATAPVVTPTPGAA